MSQLLWKSGFFHYPEAHSDHPKLVPQREILEFLAPNPYIDPWVVGKRPKTRSECIDHLRFKFSFMHREPCLFKILHEQYNYYELKMTVEDRILMESMVPGLKYIWLSRDIIERTVSAYMLFNARVDHVYNKQDYENYLKKDVHIDLEGLLKVYNEEVLNCDWSHFLEGADYLKIDYDDLVEKPRETLEKCLDHVGLGYEGLNLQAIVDCQPKFKTGDRPDVQYWVKKLRRVLHKPML